jgi:hypothetical protein
MLDNAYYVDIFSFYKKIRDFYFKKIFNIPVTLAFEKILGEFGNNSNLFINFKKSDIVFFLKKPNDDKNKQIRISYNVTLNNYLIKKILKLYKLKLNRIRDEITVEKTRFQALILRRYKLIKMLNNIKNLFLLENTFKLYNYNSLNSNIGNIKNNFKLKLLKKKFIQVFLNINKINKSIKNRSFLLKSVILKIILEKIKYLEIILYLIKDSNYFHNSKDNSTLTKLLFLRLIHLNYIKNSFEISNILNNFKLKRIFNNLEYRRRLIRKYYLSK